MERRMIDSQKLDKDYKKVFDKLFKQLNFEEGDSLETQFAKCYLMDFLNKGAPDVVTLVETTKALDQAFPFDKFHNNK